MNRLVFISFCLLLSLSSSVYALNNSSTPIKSSFTCNPTFCQCKGDDDCNNMFGSNVCGTVAECNVKTDTCTCFRFARRPTEIKKYDFYQPPINLK